MAQKKEKTQKSLKELPDLLTVEEVAELFRVTPLTIKRWGKRGKLPAIRINSRGDRRYRKEAVKWLLKEKGMIPKDKNDPQSPPPEFQQQQQQQKPQRTSSGKQKRDVSLDNLPDLLTVREVADLLRVSPLTIKRWGKRGKLPAIRINSRGDRRYRKEAVLWLLGMQDKN
jgi:excisionase family DNA binding protein